MVYLSYLSEVWKVLMLFFPRIGHMRPSFRGLLLTAVVGSFGLQKNRSLIYTYFFALYLNDLYIDHVFSGTICMTRLVRACMPWGGGI